MSNSSQAALGAYGLTGAPLEPLSGGTLNAVWRLETPDGAFVLKRYDFVDIAQVRKSIEVQQAALAHGVPVPDVVLNARGEPVTVVDGRAFVLSGFVLGRLYEPGSMPAQAARRMGEELGRLHAAIESLPPGDAPVLPSTAEIEARLRSLLATARERRGDPVDEIAEGVIEAKLELLSHIDAIPPLALQWTHGDYEWRNVLFDANDEVAAIIDFDAADYYHPARDLMRCVALSFPNLEPEVDAYFAGYASQRRLTAEDAEAYVEFYRYISTFRVWPIIERYQHPERYRPEWDALIQPFIAWDWDTLSDRLQSIAAVGGATGA